MKPALNSTRSGFTLLELLWVLLSLGILMVWSVEGYQAVAKSHRIRAAALDLVSDLRALQFLSVTARQAGWIDFEPVRGRYRIQTRTPDGQVQVVRETALPQPVRFGPGPGVLGPPSRPQGMPDPDGITFRNNQVLFQPSGVLGSGAGTVYLTGHPVHDETWAVTVTPLGRVRVYRWQGGVWR